MVSRSEIRYLNGFAHRDLFNMKGQKRKTPLFTTDKNDALTFAENDIEIIGRYTGKDSSRG